MHAVVLGRTGAADLLSLTEVAPPAVGPGDVRIAVAACGVCFHDIVVRNGTFRRGVGLPVILGHEVAGVVEALGAQVSGFALGDRVAATHHRHVCTACRHCRGGRETLCAERVFLGDAGLNGGYAELVTIGAENVVAIPDGVGFAEAAVTGCAIGSELNAIVDVGRLMAGERALVTGAGGGLGLHGVQLCRLGGAFTIGITTTAAKAAQIAAAGADAVVVTSPGADFSAEVRARTAGEGADIAIDNVGSTLFHPLRRSMAEGGRIVLVGQLGGEFASFSPAQLFLRGLSLLGAKGASRAQLETSLRLVAQGRVRPVIAATLPLDAAATAHRMVESGQVAGRVVLIPPGR